MINRGGALGETQWVGGQGRELPLIPVACSSTNSRKIKVRAFSAEKLDLSAEGIFVPKVTVSLYEEFSMFTMEV